LLSTSQWSCTPFAQLSNWTQLFCGRLGLKRNGTCAETRFCLSPKRTSPFKSAGRQFSRLLAAEVCASALVMLDTPLSEVVWEYWLTTPLTSFPFTSPPMRHREPSGFKCSLQQYAQSAVWLQLLYLVEEKLSDKGMNHYSEPRSLIWSVKCTKYEGWLISKVSNCIK